MADHEQQPIGAGRAVFQFTRTHTMLTAFLLLTPIVLRFLPLIERNQKITPHDLRGVLSDLCAGFGVVMLVTAAARFWRLGAIAVGVLWCVINYAVYEHIMALGTLPNVAHVSELADATFFHGSAVQVRHPFGLLALLLATAWVACRVRLESDWPRRVAVQGVLMIGASLGLAFWPIGPSTMIWRQEHALPVALANLFSPPNAAVVNLQLPRSIQVTDEDRAQASRALAPDLSGELQVNRPGAPVNVLLVILEGVGGAHINAIRELAEVHADINLPFLDQFSRETLCYPNFILHQCQTNRGEYAILAGDYDRLLTSEAKMTEIAGAGILTRDYLPSILKKHGYRTAYLQAAPLSYMMKNRFMPLIGFDQCWGDVDFPRAYQRTNWGVDDRALFEQCAHEIRRIDSSHEKWFVTIMTAGTHHPFVVPDDFEHLPGESDRARALRCMDRALEAFVAALEDSGVLDKTLLVITSDESPGLEESQGAMEWLSKQWGLAMVRTPSRQRGMVNEIFGQSDIALSIIDYLDLETEAAPFIGRSMFRQYGQSRPMFFAHTYGQVLGVFDADQRLHVLTERFEPFFAATFEPGAAFRLQETDELAGRRGLLWEMARRTLGEPQQCARRTIELLEDPDVQLAGQTLESKVFGGQLIEVDEDAIVQFDIDLTVSATGGNEVKFEHRFYGEEIFPAEFESHWLDDGESYRVRGWLRTGGRQSGLKLRQEANREMPLTANVHYKAARLTITPIREWSGPLLWPGEIQIQQ